MPSTVNLKALGLNISPNPIGVQDGSLINASNVIIKRDNVVESRRGFTLVGNALSDNAARAKQLMVYKNTLIRHFDNILQYDSGNFNFLNFAGNYTEQAPGLRIKSIEANGNFYFTTSDGIKKISASSQSDLINNDNVILNAGAVAGLDCTATLDVTLGNENNFFTQDSAVAYRIVWGYTDANNNLILGAPSQRTIVYNPLLNLLLQDYARILGAIDDVSNVSGSLITTSSPNYFVSNFQLPYNATAIELSNSLPTLASQLDQSIVYANTTGTGVPLTINSVSITGATSSSSSTTVTNTATVVFNTGQDPTQIFGAGGEDPNIYLNNFTLSGVTLSVSAMNSTSNTITINNHGLYNGQAISFSLGSGGALASGVTAGVTYYVINRTTNTFQISSSANGSSISLGTGFTPTVYASIPSSGTLTSTNQVVTTAFYNTSGSSITVNNVTILNNQGYITFVTPAFGTVSFTGATIASYKYTNITQPALITDAGTDDELLALQKYLQSILTELKDEVNAVISTSLENTYIQPINLTTTASVSLEITIPQGVNTNYFFQVYRSLVTQALNTQVLLTDVVPDDELAQVYEAYITQAEINAGTVTITDITPDSLRGAYLYTNASTGVGILQENDQPPFAMDINFYKNVAFYANTRTKYNQNISLLGVSNILTDISNNIVPKITITNGTSTNTYTFVEAENQITTITTTAGSTLASSGTASYFLINNANNETSYYVWYKIGTATDPALSSKTGIPVVALSSDSNSVIASKTNYTISRIIQDFETSVSSNIVTVTNVNSGPATNASAGTSGFTIATTTEGVGEGPTTIVVSNNPSPAQAITETSASFIRVINKNPNECVNIQYTSSQSNNPGQMSIVERTLSTNPFYILASDSNVGSSFSPNFSPENTISNIATGDPSVITTTSAHGLTNLDYVVITNSNSTPSIDGLYQITYISPTSFSISANVTGSGNKGAFALNTDILYVQNEIKSNRLYYSSLEQPEAVPAENYIDIGLSDKPILRIFPSRDSLFIFKEDGVFRLSGDVAPFYVTLFDLSCILIAPDSVDVVSNQIYGWTKKGIEITSESGCSVISRKIDTLVLPTPTAPNFVSSTFGVGYESDNSYLVFTTSSNTDTVATIAYRYCNLTDSWTTYDKSNTCGVNNPADDKLYLGAGDVPYIEQERKNFNRTDYADREYATNLTSNNYHGNIIQLSDVSEFNVGDVLYQDQTVGVFNFNSLLLKLDADPNVGFIPISGTTNVGNVITVTTSSAHNFITGQTVIIKNSNTTPSIDGSYVINVLGSNTFSFTFSSTILINATAGEVKYSYYYNLLAKAGDDLRSDLVSLASKLDTDPNLTNHNYSASIAEKFGAISSITATFPTIITSVSNSLINSRTVEISGTNSSPSVNGEYTVTVINGNTFSIPVSVTSPGNTGEFTTLDEDFDDLLASFNEIVSLLNSDNGTAYKNYMPVTTDTYVESIITAVNPITKQITVNLVLDYIIGPLTVYKSFVRTLTYAPNIMGDPVNYKHFREAQIIFLNKAFTNATMSFASDLNPAFTDVNFPGDGSGLFGNDTFGNNTFGGASTSVPFRTYVPRNYQRCRYILAQFTHNTAREEWSIYGTTLTGDVISTSRAYR